MAIGVNITSIGSNLIDSAVDYLGIPVNNASPIYQSRSDTDIFKLSVVSSIHGSFSCQLPSSVRVSLSSKFSNLLEGKLGIISMMNKFMQANSAITGSTISLNTKYTTAMYWEGSAPVSLSIPLELNTRTDVDREVLQPMRILGSMALPREKNGSSLLYAPGPTPIDMKSDDAKRAVSSIQKGIQSLYSDGSGFLAETQNKIVSWADATYNRFVSSAVDEESNQDLITIKVGKVLLFKRCIVTKVDWDVDLTRLLASTGKPMRVKGQLDFMTSCAMTADDWKKTLAPVSEQNSLMSEATNKLDEWVTENIDNPLNELVSSNQEG